MNVRPLLIWNALVIAAILMFNGAVCFNRSPRSGFNVETILVVPALILLLSGQLLLKRENLFVAGILLISGGLAGLPFGIVSVFIGIRAFRLLSADNRVRSAKKNCLKCGYDLQGLTKPRCPECGCLFGFKESLEDLGINEDEVREK